VVAYTHRGSIGWLPRRNASGPGCTSGKTSTLAKPAQ
jgi:hypothetical protein